MYIIFEDTIWAECPTLAAPVAEVILADKDLDNWRVRFEGWQRNFWLPNFDPRGLQVHHPDNEDVLPRYCTIRLQSWLPEDARQVKRAWVDNLPGIIWTPD